MDVIFISLGMQLLGITVRVCVVVLKTLPIYFLDSLLPFTAHLQCKRDRFLRVLASVCCQIFTLSVLIDVWLVIFE